MVPKQCTTLQTNAQKTFGKPTIEGGNIFERTSRTLVEGKSKTCSVGGIKGASVTLGASVSSMEVAAGAGAGAVRDPDEVEQDDRRLQQNRENLQDIRRVRVYFTVGARHEEALFYSNTPAEQIKDLFRAAAEASPRDILKLYSRTGQLLNINAGLEPNTPSSRYAVQAVAAHSCAMLEERAAVQLRALETRIADIERQLKADPPLPDAVRQLQRQVDAFRDKLETTESLSWLGFNKQLPMPVSTEECRRLKYRRKSDSIKKQVKMNFANICDSQVSDLVREDLRMPSFDSTQWEDEELLWLLQQMYLDFDLCSKFAIDIDTLRNFLYEAYKNYNEVPFHNFRHCFCVAQMMYAICWAVDLPSKIGDLEVLILLTSCIGHDLDHPGYNNIYQINAKTELALRYNDISPLENHHCSVAFRILENEDCNLFKSFTSDSFKVIREGMIRSILATDMARHNEILSQFKETISVFDYDNKHHVNLLCMVLIKVSDISNEARPMDVAEPWLDKLLMEFYKQSDAEKLEGLPVTPFMDRDRITKPSSQCSFIGFVLLPLFETLAELLTELQDLIVQPVRDALDYYKRLNEATKEERLQRKSIVAELSSGGDLSPAQSTGSSQGGLSKSGSNLRLKKSLSFQANRSRSRSSDTEDMSNQPDQSTASPTTLSAPVSSLGDDPPSSSLCLLEEDDNEQALGSDGEDLEEEDEEDSETNTVTEVEASEKALKFKISTEAANTTSSSFSGSSLLGNSNTGGRKSYPGSRKGSRERVISSGINQPHTQQQQQSTYQPNYRAPAKLQKSIGTLSFDHQYATVHVQQLQQQQQQQQQEPGGVVVQQREERGGENVTGLGPTGATTSLALDRRGSAAVVGAVGGGGGGVVGMVGGRLVFGGSGGDGLQGSAKAAGNNVCNIPTTIQQKSTTDTSPLVNTSPSTTSPHLIPPTTIKRTTTNFLLKTLKRQNSNKSNSNKSNNVVQHSKESTTENVMVNIPLDHPEVQDEEDNQQGACRNVDRLNPTQPIRNNLNTNSQVQSRGHSEERVPQQHEMPPNSPKTQSHKFQQVGGSTSSVSFLSRFKHFTYDRLGLLSTTGHLDKDDKSLIDGGDGGDDAAASQSGGNRKGVTNNTGLQPKNITNIKSNSSGRMTLPLIYRRKHHHQHVHTNDPTKTSCCKSLDNVETRIATQEQEHGHGQAQESSSSRLHNSKASTLPKVRRLGGLGNLGSKKHWKMFLLGGGSKRGSVAKGGRGEALQDKAVADIETGGWSSDGNVADTKEAAKGGEMGEDNDSQKSCPPSTSQYTNVTQLKNNKVTSANISGGGGGEDVQCCRTRPTKSPPPPPITVAPSLNSGNTAVLTAQPLQTTNTNNSTDGVMM